MRLQKRNALPGEAGQDATANNNANPIMRTEPAQIKHDVICECCEGIGRACCRYTGISQDMHATTLQDVQRACETAQHDLDDHQSYTAHAARDIDGMVRIEFVEWRQGGEDCAYLDLHAMSAHWTDGVHHPLADELAGLGIYTDDIGGAA